MMYVYILESTSTHRFYVGSTQDVANRLIEHNSGECMSTRHGIPWILLRVEGFHTRSEAMEQERKIKSRGIGRYLNAVRQTG